MSIYSAKFRLLYQFVVVLVISLIITSHSSAQPFYLDEGISDTLANIAHGDALWGDYDGDGDLDILIAGNTDTGSITEIYKNEGSNYTSLNAGLIGLENPSASWCDFDNDNDLDFLLIGTLLANDLDLPEAILYENMGNDEFEQVNTDLLGVFSGETVWGDLDNDGDQDLLMIGDKGGEGVTRIYRNDGLSEFTLIDQNLSDVYSGDIDIGDFDNDMDLDILLIGLTSNSSKVLNLYRNDGEFNFSGVFSEFIGMSESCLEWADYDFDGDLDILANGSTEAPTHLVYIYQNQGDENFMNIGIEIFGTVNGSVNWGDYNNDGDFDFLLTGMPSYTTDPLTEIYRNININLFNMDDSVDLIGVYNSSSKWGDYDNDGDLDILLSGSKSETSNFTGVYTNKNVIVNTPPSTPEDLQSVITNNSVQLSWMASFDNETPSAGLTYNIRVGTTQGGADIVSSLAGPSGNLFVPTQGNVGPNLSWIINGLASGTYYWSVHAIDNNFAGSEFAEEVSFEILTTDISDQELQGLELKIKRCYPNPFFDKLNIEILSPGNKTVSINVYDIKGKIVRKLVEERPINNFAKFEWNGLDDKSERLQEAQYFITVQTGEMVKSSKVILLD